MRELVAQFTEWRDAIEARLPSWWPMALAGTLIALGILLPFAFAPTSGFMDATIKSLAFVVMALGLNIVVGFAGLLDLGYVAFYAIGAYSVGWFASGFFYKAHVHILSSALPTVPGIHFNFLLVLLSAAVLCAVMGAIIGLPTLRLRGDYIAIVTLAFGEIIGTIAVNGTDIHLTGGNGTPPDPGMTLTAGEQGGSPLHLPHFPRVGKIQLLNLRARDWPSFAIL